MSGADDGVDDVETPQKIVGVTPLTDAEEESETLPVARRRCTDVLALVLFLMYLVGMVFLTALSSRTGNPERLMYGHDAQGRVCGGSELPLQTRVAYPRANDDILNSGVLSNPASLVRFFGVCVAECPRAGDFVCTSEAESEVTRLLAAGHKGFTDRESLLHACVTDFYSALPFGAACGSELVASQCWESPVDTQAVLFRCLPKYVYEVETLPESGCTRFRNVTSRTGQVKQVCVVYKKVTKVTREQPTASNVLIDTFNGYYATAQQGVADVVRAHRPILASGLGVTLAFGLLYMASLYCCVGVVVWLTVLLTVAVSVLFTLYCYVKAGLIPFSALSGAYETVSSFVTDAADKVLDSSNSLLNVDAGVAVEVNKTEGGSESISILPSSISASTRYQHSYQVASYAFTAFTIVLVLLVLSLMERISNAIAIFEQAAAAIRDHMWLLLLPFLSTATMMGVVFVWGISTAFVATAGTFEVVLSNNTYGLPSVQLANGSGTGSNLSSTTTINELGALPYTNLFVIYMFFGLLWILNFMNACTVMTVSGAVLRWFWADKVGGSAESGVRPVLGSFFTVLRYHLGTAALGGLLLAVLQFVRYAAAACERRLAAMGKESRAVRLLFCVVHFFLACVNRVVKFISRNALIWTALYGDPFCASARKSFGCVASNIAQVAMVTFLGDIIERFGQLLMTLSAGLACWVWIDRDPAYGLGGERELSSTSAPVGFTMLIAWFVAAEVMSVYDVACDCILLSYCQDRRLRQLKPSYQERSPEAIKDFYAKHELKDQELIKQAASRTVQ